jgi:hypothetical protein
MRKERSQGHFDVSGGFCFIFQQGPKNEAKSEALWQCGVPVFFAFPIQRLKRLRPRADVHADSRRSSKGIALACGDGKPDPGSSFTSG